MLKRALLVAPSALVVAALATAATGQTAAAGPKYMSNANRDVVRTGKVRVRAPTGTSRQGAQGGVTGFTHKVIGVRK